MAGAAHAQGGEDKREFCVAYANEAVDMQRRNIRLNCGIQGVRWHEWWDAHYGWCKDWVSRREVVEHTELRRSEMRACEDRADYRLDSRDGYRERR
ncbi:MAG: hypothetical protein NW215_08890 [Hyphomicrobiales bacterium]|nr:hypothetical protein [Hyphomicrobiales bacterium]